jgi:hypothetical protein
MALKTRSDTKAKYILSTTRKYIKLSITYKRLTVNTSFLHEIPIPSVRRISGNKRGRERESPKNLHQPNA